MTATDFIGGEKGKPMNPPNETTCPLAQTQAPPDSREVVALLQRIVELLDEIDGSLANIGGKLDDIHTRMP